MVCPDCAVERADYEGPDGAWLPICPNCGSQADPAPVTDEVRRLWALAEALREAWLSGEQLNLARPVGERIDWAQYARAVEQRLAQDAAAVDTAGSRQG
jgi:NMD protein affecting ribosome stability and mRNA decay